MEWKTKMKVQVSMMYSRIKTVQDQSHKNFKVAQLAQYLIQLLERKYQLEVGTLAQKNAVIFHCKTTFPIERSLQQRRCTNIFKL